MRRSGDYKESASQCQWNALFVSRVSTADINKQDIELKNSWSEARGMPGNILNNPWVLGSAASLLKENGKGSSLCFQKQKSRIFISKNT